LDCTSAAVTPDEEEELDDFDEDDELFDELLELLDELDDEEDVDALELDAAATVSLSSSPRVNKKAAIAMISRARTPTTIHFALLDPEPGGGPPGGGPPGGTASGGGPPGGTTGIAAVGGADGGSAAEMGWVAGAW